MTSTAIGAHRGAGTGWTQAAANLGFALVQLDVTVVNVALPRLGTDLGAGNPYWMALPAFVPMPAGVGTGIPAMIGAMLGSVDRSRSGVAAAVTNAARQAGGAVGVAVFRTLAGPNLLGGLHAGAAISAVLRVAMALVAWALVPGRAAPR